MVAHCCSVLQQWISHIFKYADRLPKPMLDFLLAPKIIDHAVPSHYALCQKPQECSGAS